MVFDLKTIEIIAELVIEVGEEFLPKIIEIFDKNSTDDQRKEVTGQVMSFLQEKKNK